MLQSVAHTTHHQIIGQTGLWWTQNPCRHTTYIFILKNRYMFWFLAAIIRLHMNVNRCEYVSCVWKSGALLMLWLQSRQLTLAYYVCCRDMTNNTVQQIWTCCHCFLNDICAISTFWAMIPNLEKKTLQHVGLSRNIQNIIYNESCINCNITQLTQKMS